MKFSIIIPVYNVEDCLSKCLDSIIKQSYQNYEAIIVCDKCNDNSEKIVDKYVKESNKFIKIYEENTGLAKARNIGINKANGNYILFLDGDDYYELDLLETLNRELSNEEVLRFQVQDVINGKVIKHEENGFDTTSGVHAFDYIIKYHYIETAWSYCYKRDFFVQNKFKYYENCIAEDYGLTPLIIAKAKKVKSISYIGYNYVQREDSLMNKTSYSEKLKKMQDMLCQANVLKKELKDIKDNDKFIMFINNSLIYYSTKLKYKDFRKYAKILKEQDVYFHLKAKHFKGKVRCFLIKWNAYVFYNFIVRFV